MFVSLFTWLWTFINIPSFHSLHFEALTCFYGLLYRWALKSLGCHRMLDDGRIDNLLLTVLALLLIPDCQYFFSRSDDRIIIPCVILLHMCSLPGDATIAMVWSRSLPFQILCSLMLLLRWFLIFLHGVFELLEWKSGPGLLPVRAQIHKFLIARGCIYLSCLYQGPSDNGILMSTNLLRGLPARSYCSS